MGSPVKPVLGAFAPVEFTGLTVEVRVNKAGGLGEVWRAEDLASEKPAAAPKASAS